jgi:type II secretion system protein H
MTPRRNNSGFTLMELVLVLLILALCAAAATPALRGFTRGRRLPNTAQELALAARWCRVQAISEGTTYRLNMSVKESKWWVTKEDLATGTYVSVATDFMPEETLLPEGIAMDSSIAADSDGLQYISFDPGGRTDVGTIQLMSDGIEVDVGCDTPLGLYHVVKSNG